MNIEDLAQIFDGLSRGFAAGLKEKEKKELIALSNMFRRFPNQGVSDFINFVEGAFCKEKNSVPALLERIKLFKQGTGESRQELEGDLATLRAPELKKLVAGLGMKAATKGDDNRTLLKTYLSNGDTQDADIPPTPDMSQAVETAHLLYEAIKRDLSNITIEEMRSRFSAISDLPKPVLAGLLSKLGYSVAGSKDNLATTLLENLNSIKLSLDQTKHIGS